MESFVGILAVILFSLVALFFFGPVIAIISIMGKLKIGEKSFYDLEDHSTLQRVSIAVVGVFAWLVVIIFIVWIVQMFAPSAPTPVPIATITPTPIDTETPTPSTSRTTPSATLTSTIAPSVTPTPNPVVTATPNIIVPNVGLISLSYAINDGDSEVIDLRHADTGGIALKVDDRIQLSQLYYSVEWPEGVKMDADINAELLALYEPKETEPIGHTNDVKVSFDSGYHLLGDFNEITVQSHWTGFRVVLVASIGGQKVNSVRYDINIDRTGEGSVGLVPAYVPGVTPIESIPLTVKAYGGISDENVGSGTSRISVKYLGHSKIGYRFWYELPEEANDSYAGFVFAFTEPQDLSIYDFIEMTIAFEGNAVTDLTVSDGSDPKYYLRLGDSRKTDENIEVTVSKGRHEIRVPINEFTTKVNINNIEEIGFNSGSSFTKGSHEFTVSDVKFTSQ